MTEIKAYLPTTNSLCEGQVLSSPYEYQKARIIVREMAGNLAYQLSDKDMGTHSLTMDIGYDRENCDNGSYSGEIHIDHYGRKVPKGAHGSIQLAAPTNLERQLTQSACELFDRIADPKLLVRRITIATNRVTKDEGIYQFDLFTDTEKLEKEKRLQSAMLGIKKKYGKNAVLKGTNFLKGATIREWNGQVGGTDPKTGRYLK